MFKSIIIFALFGSLLTLVAQEKEKASIEIETKLLKTSNNLTKLLKELGEKRYILRLYDTRDISLDKKNGMSDEELVKKIKEEISPVSWMPSETSIRARNGTLIVKQTTYVLTEIDQFLKKYRREKLLLPEKIKTIKKEIKKEPTTKSEEPKQETSVMIKRIEKEESKKISVQNNHHLQETLNRRSKEELKQQQAIRLKIRNLFNKGTIHFEKQEFRKAEEFANQILEIDPSNRYARRLRDDSIRTTHRKFEKDYMLAKAEGWKRFREDMVGVDGIPYTQVMSFPSKEKWELLTRKNSLKQVLPKNFVLKKEKWETFLEKQKTSEDFALVIAPRLSVFNNQKFNISVLNQKAYISKYKLSLANEALLIDPVIETAQLGYIIEGTASIKKSLVQLKEMTINFSEEIGPTKTIKTSVGPIELVSIYNSTFAINYTLKADEVLVVGPMPYLEKKTQQFTWIIFEASVQK